MIQKRIEKLWWGDRNIRIDRSTQNIDNQYAAEAGYYKFYFEEVKNGEVVDQIRMDLGMASTVINPSI